ncbi:MAG: sporulation integral membrane protein YtvI [Christensenellales bacterium]|jgi:sporulation integral membrane protein YtvI
MAVETEAKKKFIVHTLYYAIIAGILYFLFRYAIYTIMPFLIAFAVASVLRPLVRFLIYRCRLKRPVASAILVILFYGTVGLLLVLLGIRITISLRDFVQRLPSLYQTTVSPALTEIFNRLEAGIANLGPDLADTVSDFTDGVVNSLGALVSDLSSALVTSVTRYAASIPGILPSILFTIIATFFIAADYRLIIGFVLKQLPDKPREVVRHIGTSLKSTLLKYLKSYSLIFLITFTELAIGLSLLGIEKWPFFALGIALFDILPIFGSSMILVPWTVVLLLQGEYLTGIGMCILWLLITVLRQFIEPKIVGDQVGLHPLVTLIAMVVGTSLFGVVGLFGLPISLAILKRLHDQGDIKVYNDLLPEDLPPEPVRPKRRKKGNEPPRQS